MRRGARRATALSALGLAVAWLAGTGCNGGGAEVPLYTVRRESFVRRVRAEGQLEAVRATPVLVPSVVRRPYQIAWLAPEGRPVAAGQVVLRFDPTELEASAEDAQAKRQTAELEIARESVSAEATARNLERDAELAAEELDNVSSFQKRDEELFSRFQILESEIDRELAALRRSHAESSRESNRELSRSELALLAIERRKSEAMLDRTEEALAQLEVAAPHAGILIHERDWRGRPLRPGATVFSGQTVARLPDLSEMKAEVFVLEADAGGLQKGQEATVVIESRPDLVYRGRVIRVDTLAGPRLEASPVQYFGATIELERTDPEVMKPGQRVVAEILVAELPEALVLPRQALVEEGDRHYVFKKSGREFERIEVVLEAAGLGRVTVAGGLEPGDVIAARDPGLRIETLAAEPEEPASAIEAGGGG